MSASNSVLQEAYLRLIRLDLVVVRVVLNFRLHSQIAIVDNLVSHLPLRDISLLTWFVFIIKAFELGFSFVWTCVFNMVAAYFLRESLQAPGPAQFDRDAAHYQLADFKSWAFPSLESFMCVILGGSIALDTESSFVHGVVVMYTLLVGFTRVYACSRFLHQIVGSWLLGLVGLVFADQCKMQMRGNMFHEFHYYMTLAVVLVGGAGIMLRIENNDSTLLNVEKDEYVRVLSGILTSEGINQVDDGRSEEDGESAGPAPRQRRKKDSFYRMMKGIEKRAVAAKYATEGPEYGTAPAASDGF
jgi:hypothetical protein